MSKKIVTITESVLNTISGLIPNLLNIQIKIEGAEFDPFTKKASAEEIIIDLNLGNKY